MEITIYHIIQAAPQLQGLLERIIALAEGSAERPQKPAEAPATAIGQGAEEVSAEEPKAAEAPSSEAAEGKAAEEPKPAFVPTPTAAPAEPMQLGIEDARKRASALLALHPGDERWKAEVQKAVKEAIRRTAMTFGDPNAESYKSYAQLPPKMLTALCRELEELSEVDGKLEHIALPF